MIVVEKFADLRSQVLEVLEEILGTYNTPIGIFPAIAVEGTGFPPPATEVEGLEAVIVPISEVEVKPLLGRSHFWALQSELILKQWGNGDTLEAIGLVIPLLGNQIKIKPRIPKTSRLGNIETCTIEFTWSNITRGNY